jgi:hypothetical protein
MLLFQHSLRAQVSTMDAPLEAITFFKIRYGNAPCGFSENELLFKHSLKLGGIVLMNL